MIAQSGVQDPLDGACVTAPEEHGLASDFAQRNDLHGSIRDGAQEPIQRRSAPQHFPADAEHLQEVRERRRASLWVLLPIAIVCGIVAS